MRDDRETVLSCPSCAAADVDEASPSSVSVGPLEDGVQVVYIDPSAGIEKVAADLERTLAPILRRPRSGPVAIRARGEQQDLAVV